MNRWLALLMTGALTACGDGSGRRAVDAEAMPGWEDVAGDRDAAKDGTNGPDVLAEIRGEAEAICQPDCQGKECGPDGCGGACGWCGESGWCQDGNCAEDYGPHVPESGQKITRLTFSDSAHPGDALDIDGNENTCAPAGQCAGGVDNQLSGLWPVLAGLLPSPQPLQALVDDGSLVLLLPAEAWPVTGESFAFYVGEGSVVNEPWCTDEGEDCGYRVSASSFDPVSMTPVTQFGNSSIWDGVLTAGGPDHILKLTVPVQAGLGVDIVVNAVHVRAHVGADPAGHLALHNGLLGGALRKDKLLQAIDLLPASGDLDKAAIKATLEEELLLDMDTDDDGVADAFSLALRFETVPVEIAGVGE